MIQKTALNKDAKGGSEQNFLLTAVSTQEGDEMDGFVSKRSSVLCLATNKCSVGYTHKIISKHFEIHKYCHTLFFFLLYFLSTLERKEMKMEARVFKNDISQKKI